MTLFNHKKTFYISSWNRYFFTFSVPYENSLWRM